MWSLAATDDYERSLRWYAKKRPRELQAVLDNLDTFHEALKTGAKPQQIKTGYIHPEPRGILAIDQKGGPGKLQQTRLYVFPDGRTEILWLLAIGGKNSQHPDILMCIDFVDELLERKSQ